MKGTVLIAGALAQRPNQAGHTWQFLQYLLGFRRLGWDVLFLDRLEPDMCVDAAGQRCPVEDSVNLAYLRGVMERYDLSDSYSLLFDRGRRTFGQSREQVLERTRRSAVLLNVMGFFDDEEVLAAAPLRVFLDTDPGFGQMWQDLGQATLFTGHDRYVTIGENIGRPHCTIPTCGIDWITTAQPVVMEEWRDGTTPPREAITSIGAWRGPYAPIEHGGRTYGLRVHEFRKFAALPSLCGRTFEVALDIHPDETADLSLLARHGWKLVQPQTVARDPDVYRRYIWGSMAELMIAKNIYVQSNSGWFSERSMCYLAAGRPVIAQDTGLREIYPLGRGLLTFSDLVEAEAAVAEVHGAYDEHAEAAREIAGEYFDSERVLPRLLTRLGVA